MKRTGLGVCERCRATVVRARHARTRRILTFDVDLLTYRDGGRWYVDLVEGLAATPPHDDRPTQLHVSHQLTCGAETLVSQSPVLRERWRANHDRLQGA